MADQPFDRLKFTDETTLELAKAMALLEIASSEAETEGNLPVLLEIILEKVTADRQKISDAHDA